MDTVDFSARPQIVFWEITKACSLACAHCRATARPSPAPGELTTDEGLALIQDLAQLDPAPRLVLTGGDPLERPDLLQLVRAAASRGIPVALAPAPSRRLNDRTLRDLKDAGAWGVALSIDFPDAAANDAFRRYPGALRIASTAIERARTMGLAAQVNTVAMRENLRDLPRLFSLVRSLGATAWEIIPIIPTGRAARFEPLQPLEMEALLHFLYDAGGFGLRVHAAEAPASRRVALARRAERDMDLSSLPLYVDLRAALMSAHGEPGPNREPLGRTRSGAGVVFIAASGSVMPSGFLPLACGNVRVRPVTDLYRESPVFRALREPALFKGPCGVCDYREVCGGSRARAFAATGDPLETDPSCRLAWSKT
ncbi:MAG: TIGR04053 family radical SAM/SPASM domain-containing protein [Thermoplasmatota archaeon]